MTFTHRASDSERVEGKKNLGDDGEEEATKNGLLQKGVWIFNKWGQKKCHWVVNLNSLPTHFSNLVSLYLDLPSTRNNCRIKSPKIIRYQSSAKSILKWAVQSEFISWKNRWERKKNSQLRQIEGLIFLAAGLNVIF